MYIIRQSTAIDVAVGPFLDSTDGVTVESGLTITQPDIRLSKNGAAFAQKSAAQTASHMENGYYSVNLSTTDTNTVGTLRLHVNETGGLPVWLEFQVVEEAIYDALYAASATGLLPANVTQFNGVAATSSSGRPEVNTTHAAGTAWGSGAITAASIASNAIADTKIATGAITSAKFAASAINAAAIATDAITAAKIASGAITSAKIAAGALDAVWSTTTRLLTAGTNIVLAKGAGVTGFNDLSAADVNAEADTALSDYDAPTKAELDSGLAALNDLSATEVRGALGLASANLDTQLSTIDNEVGAIDTVVDSILEDTGTTLPATLATIDGEIGVIDGIVDDILVDTAVIGAAGAGLTEAGGTGDQLTAVPWNAAWDAQVESEVTDALNAYDPPTKAELDAGIAGLLTDIGEQTRVFTAQAGGASTITLDASASAVDDFYNGALVVILDGTGDTVPVAERTRRITDYVGSTKVATVDAAWGTQPDNTTRALIFGRE